MPGVPSGRGCDACRKQKKKCDQTQPSCSRCTRLSIPCVGSGQQRYTFKHSTALTRTSSTASSSASSSNTPVINNGTQIRPFAQANPSPIPSNDLTLLTNSFTSALASSSCDPRFDLSIYGPFFQEIPQRLGRNVALDASVLALVTSFRGLSSRSQGLDAYRRYADALRALRDCLSDGRKEEAETLCAIYLVMICQGWIAQRDDHAPSHGEAMAHLMNEAARTNRHWQGTFETGLLVTLSVIVTLESFPNPKIRLDPKAWSFLPEHFGPRSALHDRYAVDSLKLRNLSALVELMRNYDTRLPEIQMANKTIREDCNKMKTILSETIGADVPVTDLPLPVKKLHVRYQSTYGTLLCLAIALNIICRGHDRTCQGLVEDAEFYVHECITLGDNSVQYRPLGASSIPLCLIGASLITDDVTEKASIHLKLGDWQQDFPCGRWLEIAIKMKKNMQEYGWAAAPKGACHV